MSSSRSSNHWHRPIQSEFANWIIFLIDFAILLALTILLAHGWLRFEPPLYLT